METTLLYGGLLGMFMAILSIRIPLRRAAQNIPWGHGNDSILDTRIRVFGNFIEYVPIILILMALLETSGMSARFLHSVGSGLLAARLVHAISLKDGECPLWRKIGRAMGAMLTWLILLVCAGFALYISV